MTGQIMELVSKERVLSYLKQRKISRDFEDDASYMNVMPMRNQVIKGSLHLSQGNEGVQNHGVAKQDEIAQLKDKIKQLEQLQYTIQEYEEKFKETESIIHQQSVQLLE